MKVEPCSRGVSDTEGSGKGGGGEGKGKVGEGVATAKKEEGADGGSDAKLLCSKEGGVRAEGEEGAGRVGVVAAAVKGEEDAMEVDEDTLVSAFVFLVFRVLFCFVLS